MSTVKEESKANEPLKGGEFLIKESESNIFTPEDWSEEDLMITEFSIYNAKTSHDNDCIKKELACTD